MRADLIPSGLRAVIVSAGSKQQLERKGTRGPKPGDVRRFDKCAFRSIVITVSRAS
jgi:hypothetical protein